MVLVLSKIVALRTGTKNEISCAVIAPSLSEQTSWGYLAARSARDCKLCLVSKMVFLMPYNNFLIDQACTVKDGWILDSFFRVIMISTAARL